MKTSEELNKDRINNMIAEVDIAECPSCKGLTCPRLVKHKFNADSGLRWCNLCFKGNARMMWRYL